MAGVRWLRRVVPDVLDLLDEDDDSAASRRHRSKLRHGRVRRRCWPLRVSQASDGTFSPDALLPFMDKERHADGDVLFRKGDDSHKLYLIREGQLAQLGEHTPARLMQPCLSNP